MAVRFSYSDRDKPCPYKKLGTSGQRGSGEKNKKSSRVYSGEVQLKLSSTNMWQYQSRQSNDQELHHGLLSLGPFPDVDKNHLRAVIRERELQRTIEGDTP